MSYDNNQVSLDIQERTPPWADQLDHNSLLVFVHIPKSGGTSLKGYLQHIYGRFCMTYHAPFHPNVLENATKESAKNVLSIASHFPYGIHRQFGSKDKRHPLEGDGLFEGRDIRYVSIFREPVARIVSLYNFVTTFPHHRFHKAVQGMSIEAFLDFFAEKQPEIISNCQCFLVSKDRTFEFAKTFVEENYFLVAPLERSVEFIQILSRKMAWPTDAGKYVIRNESPKAESPDALNDTLRERILSLNSEDAKLYRYVEQRFEEILKDHDEKVD